MAVLKTYARLWPTELDLALPLFTELTGRPVDLRFAFGDLELATVGDFLLIAGPPQAQLPFRGQSATVVVDDLDAARATLASHGAVELTEELTGVTGRYLFARHADGSEVEYVEWTPEITAKVLGPAHGAA
ncbi:VOC family protein [Kitasatospora sp. NPDC008050]|uniref:VOC family protein n=1 Tax=Kitasatospora sp. NPDC008050 TaxID=3364021 RepID=UPI0036E289B5